jgi:beta-lactamase regulating signal transducer with metallopeptidase domain
MIALWMIYATVAAALVGGAAALLERASAGQIRQRRWVWVLALTLAVLVPAWTALAARLNPAPPGATNAGANAPQTQLMRLEGNALTKRLVHLIDGVEPSSLGRLDTALAFLWASMTSLALVAYGLASWSLARRRREWRPATVDGHAVLLAPAIGPAVVGSLRPTIVVPEWSLDLSNGQRALMLAHEREHVRARDPLVLHAAAMVALLMPWNVAAWWLNRRLRLAVELDCDARVLAGGQDVRSYGTLLLDVCARRARPGALLAPALLERTSSLTKRILAMQPERSRFPRTRVALGAAAACVVVLLACEIPTPEMLAPDGKDAAMQRLYGKVTAAGERRADDPRETVARYFPDIARGEGEPSILFVVKSAAGGVVLTKTQPAAFARMPGPRGDVAERTSTGLPKVRLRQSDTSTPTGIGALRPEDIAAVDVTKHAAGSVAPKAVSIITIVLNPGAKIPQTGGAP